jgi:hypothetical protein
MAQFQQTGGVIPPQGPAADTPEQPVDYSQPPDTDDIEPAPVHGGEEHDEENDAKRARYV